MPTVSVEHFERAALDISAHGDNDTLPFDADTRFVSVKQSELTKASFAYLGELLKDGPENNKKKISGLSVFSERLLSPTGPSGFRVSTKIHPFWNLYFNGLGVAIADAQEGQRDVRVHSYRFDKDGTSDLFKKESSWRAFKNAAVAELDELGGGGVVVQTDISSFYERISHHHIENFVADVFDDENRIAKQINALLGKFSGGRSFGLPVGGQCARVLAELFLSPVDQMMTQKGIRWHRYVDDYVLIAESHSAAYSALSQLSHTLADYGLTLNKTKTVLLGGSHYADYVSTQMGTDDSEAGVLRSIDLHFDPYSDEPAEDYESLRNVVEGLQIQKLLNRELEKALPDTFLVSQIGRTLRLNSPADAMQVASTLLSPGNLHAFRASWSTLMRGVAGLRADSDFQEIFGHLDTLLDNIPTHSQHLMHAETSLLHYLRTIRFTKTSARARFVHEVYERSRSETVRRACIDCWRHWKDRGAFTHVRNQWSQMSPECQRMVWLAASSFGDQGDGFKRQEESNLDQAWRLGIERQGVPSYTRMYKDWCADAKTS